MTDCASERLEPHHMSCNSFQKAILEQKIDLKDVEKEVIGTEEELKPPTA